MSAIAVIGAGPQLGLEVARVFGTRGYDVALVSRSQERVDQLAQQLQSEGVDAVGFAADVLDRPALKEAIEAAAVRFGMIEVVEYSPVDKLGGASMAMPSSTRPEDVQEQLEAQLYGAIAATEATLPAMRAAGRGTLLFTTGAGSVNPVPQIANVNAAAAALRNWSVNLNQELAGSGVYAAHVGINVSINVSQVPGFPVAPASTIAAAYWDLHRQRSEAEFIFNG